ncbi:MAG: pentapeptide repeat-containing protein [Saprospiraceae bacterium]
MNWLSRFQNMADELRQHSQVELLSFNSFLPIEEEQFNFLEKKHNITFPKNIRTFYRETNGLQLSWILKNNEHFSKERYSSSNEILPWDFFKENLKYQDGVIMLLPLEVALGKNIFDAFSPFYNMLFSLKNFHLTLSEDDHFSESFLTTDLDSYLEFLLAGKGLVSRRNFFYKRTDNFLLKKISTHISTPSSFWTNGKTLNLNQAILNHKFPFCDQVRFIQNNINHVGLRQMAEKGELISLSQLEGIIEKHHQFLMSGGVGGTWRVLEIRGIVTAFYGNKIDAQEGEQVNFERKNLTNISFEKIELPFSNCCSVFAEGVNFSYSTFEKSIFSDAFLQEADFSNSTFTNVDFSRSDLKNVNFKNTDLRNADFENCDLRGANFENAKLEGASFIGCLLI